MADLICVAPDRVHEFWPHARELIHKATRRTNLNHFLDIEYDVLSGDGLLWLAWSGKIEAAATTILIETETEKVCVLTACGGEDMKQWLPLFSQIEAYAKQEGCARVRIYGRRGWSRVLKGYDVTNYVMERTL